ncbi:hypothetical protein ACWC0C_44190 [Streptomyces sp. NPDC001709]
MVTDGLRLDHLPGLRAAGLDAFRVVGTARLPGGSGPSDAATVDRRPTARDASAPLS